jgi:hypothetical protein
VDQSVVEVQKSWISTCNGCDTRLNDVIPQLICAFLLYCNRRNCDLLQRTTPDTLRHADQPQGNGKYSAPSVASGRTPAFQPTRRDVDKASDDVIPLDSLQENDGKADDLKADVGTLGKSAEGQNPVSEQGSQIGAMTTFSDISNILLSDILL